MGRELRRVPMDFDWPHNKVWPGFVNPHYRHCPKQGTECFNGYTPGGIWLERIVDLLLLAGSDAAEVTRGIRPGRIWPHPWLTGLPLAPAVGPGSDLANLTSGLAGRPPSIMGHDTLDCHAAMQAIRKAAGMPEDWGICPVCKGSDIDPEIREKYEAWEQELPPEGPGYQLWETTSEGSPISPVFSTAEALADWCAEYASVFGSMMMPSEKWLQSFKAGTTDVDTMLVAHER